MISAPTITVQCDQMDAETRQRCRVSEVLALPTFTNSREAMAALFTTLNEEWHIAPGSLAVWCPNCRRRHYAKRLAEAGS